MLGLWGRQLRIFFWDVFLMREGAGVVGGTGCVCVCTDARACSDGQSPLYAASLGGHILCIEALIHAKADVLQCDKYVFQGG